MTGPNNRATGAQLFWGAGGRLLRSRARGLLRLVVLAPFFFYSGPLQAQAADSVSTARLCVVYGGTAAGFAAGYALQRHMWWKGERSPFHAEWKNDWSYALGADKLGHAFFPYLVTDVYGGLFSWCGYGAGESVLRASVLALTYQTFIEVRDGFSKEWGFSWGDFAADLAGAAYPLLQFRYPRLRSVHFKISYYPSNRYGTNSNRYILDDYESTFHWISFDIKSLAPDWYPGWLNLAVGHGVENLDFPESRSHEIYLSLDWNLASLAGEPGLLREALRLLDHYHFPAPAVRLYPRVVWMGLKF